MEQLAQNQLPMWALLLIVAWTMPWKGVALWKAARNSHKTWFIVLFIINILAIPEIIYILFFSKKKEINEQGDNNV